MFETSYLADRQSYLVVDYSPFSLTVGLLVFEKGKPRLTASVKSFFGAHEREFHPRTFERNFSQSCDDLREKIGG